MVRFHLPKGPDFGQTQLTVARMIKDVKHSKNWMCEFCGLWKMLMARVPCTC